MTPERWQQIKAIFDQAAERNPASRADFLRERCGSDEELRREVESLLASDGSQDSLLETSAMGAGGAAVSPISSPVHEDSFGPYVPIRALGEGGMGTVYLARQEQPIRREVALKVVKLGMDSRQVLERFEIERQALALMEHPNVARVLDAGTSKLGRPYFVMEYVEGVPITQYCDQKALRTGERLQLFIPVCNALQHAHKKGIIHRDVKPSNVLVMEVDGEPVPKVIDFGIARATDQRSVEREAFTLAGQIVGTPEYMSPEQAGMDSRDIDTGTDVYSLGVVLYELLVGALPLDMKELRKIAFGEVMRAIRDTPVPRPTARITQMGDAADAIARQRGTNAGQLKRDLSGDLDWIVMKAIDKDRQCRYGSASEFAADIERYLKSEPVLAGPPSAVYRMRKFVVRHKRPVAAAAAIVLALVGGIFTTAWEAHVAEQKSIEVAKQRDAAQAASRRAESAERTATMQRDLAQQERNAALAEKRRADAEAASASAVNDFLRNDVLAQADPFSQAKSDTKSDPDLKVRTALDRAAARIAGKFGAQPMVEASIRMTIGETYIGLSLAREAQPQIERALDLRRRVLGNQHPDTLWAMAVLGSMYRGQHKYAEAERLLTKSLEGQLSVPGEEHQHTLDTMAILGGLYTSQEKYAEAEPIIIRYLEVERRVRGEEHTDTVEAMYGLGLMYYSQHKYAQAESLLSKGLEIRRRVLGDEHPDTLLLMNRLANVYQHQRKDTEAEPLFSKVLEVGRRVMGEEHWMTTGVMEVLGATYQRQRRYAEAERFLSKALEVKRRLRGEEDLGVLNSIYYLALLYLDQGKYAEAEPLYARVLEVWRRLLGPQDWLTTAALAYLGELRLKQRKYSDAEMLLREALANYVKLPDHWQRYKIQSLLGGSLAGQRKYVEAEPLLLSGYQGMIQRQGAAPQEIRPDEEGDQAGERIVELYHDWGKPEQAAEWQSKLKARKAASPRQE